MEKDLPLKLDHETLRHLPVEQLVDMIIKQAIAIQELQKVILQLEQEILRLKVSTDLDSKV